MDYSKNILANGLTLLTVPMASVRSVTALLMVGVGSRYETQAQRGLAHFLEHMVFKGTKKYPTSLKLAAAVDGIGAEFNAFTGKEYTGFYVKAAKQHLPLALEILAELVFRPLLELQEIEKERGVIIEEIKMYNDQPMAKVALDFETLLYGQTALGWETVGTPATISQIQRTDFLTYLKRWYQPKNMVMAIAGAVSPQVPSLAEKYFLLPSQEIGERKTGFKPLAFSQQQPKLHFRFKKTEQAHFCLGVRTFKRASKKRYALAVLATILGGNMSSRLFMEIREKRGLAYYVKTNSQLYLDNGYLMTQAGTAIDKAGEAVALTLKEYLKVKKRTAAIKSQELKKAKEYLKGKLILDLEDSQEVAGMYAEDYLLEGKVRSPDEIISQIEAVSLEDVLAVTEQIFRPEKLNLAVIGPYKAGDRRQFENILK